MSDVSPESRNWDSVVGQTVKTKGAKGNGQTAIWSEADADGGSRSDEGLDVNGAKGTDTDDSNGVDDALDDHGVSEDYGVKEHKRQKTLGAEVTGVMFGSDEDIDWEHLRVWSKIIVLD